MKSTELQPIVATDARIGGSPRVVLVNEIIDDPSKIILEIQGVERDSEFR